MKKNIKIEIPAAVEKIGIFSDLHGNDYYLSKLFSKHPEIEHWFSAGDAIDMFEKSWNNIPTLRKMHRKNVLSILGNHETEILNSQTKLKEYHKESELLEYLQNMPFSFTLYFGGFIIDIFHSTPNGVNDYIYPNAPAEDFIQKFFPSTSDIIIVGHTHKQFNKIIGSQRIINPGVLGLEEKSYCIIDQFGDIKFYNLNNK